MTIGRSNPATRHSLLLFFLLAYALSWAVEIPLALRAQGLIAVPIPWSLHYLAAYGPMLAAIIVTGLTSGREGLRELFGRMLKWRVRPVWWLVALAPLVLYALLALVLRFIPGQGADLAALGEIDFLPNLGAGALLVWFLTFGLGEETGWRGYALPRLQRGRSALSATVILWVFWALWHLPFFFYLYDVTVIPGLLLGLLAGAITFTWLYNSTGGSILLVAVWHGAFNFVTGCLACKTGLSAAVVSTLVMVWAVVVVVWFKPATLSRAGKQTA
jgi:membrane protease YdiL (CAAX protease family)